MASVIKESEIEDGEHDEERDDARDRARTKNSLAVDPWPHLETASFWDDEQMAHHSPNNKAFFTASQWAGSALSKQSAGRQGETPLPNPYVLSMVKKARKLCIPFRQIAHFSSIDSGPGAKNALRPIEIYQPGQSRS